MAVATGTGATGAHRTNERGDSRAEGPRKRRPLLRGARSCRDGEAHRAQGFRVWVRQNRKRWNSPFTVSDPVPKVMSLPVILKHFLCRHSVLPFALLRGRTRSLPVGRLAGSQEGRERGAGATPRAPCAGEGASRPEWEGEGRMAYMPEVRNGLPTCRAVLPGASHHGRRREGCRGGRPGGRGVCCHGRPCCTRLMPIRCPLSRARRRGCPSRGCSAPSGS